MAKVQIKDNKPSLGDKKLDRFSNIESIEIKRLFGLYDYQLNLNKHVTSSSNLMVLYGDNGSGKTTILNLVYHLLSNEGDKGHRFFLLNVPFLSLKVILSCGAKITALRKNIDDTNLLGCYTILVEDGHNKKIEANFLANADQADPNKLRLEPYLNWLKSKEITLRFISENRHVRNYADSDIELGQERIFRIRQELEFPRLRTKKLENPIDEVTLRTLESFNDWVKISTSQGLNDGEANANTIYNNIISRVAQQDKEHISDNSKEITEKVIRDITSIEITRQSYIKYGLFTNIDFSKILKILKSENQKSKSIISEIIEPYVESTLARFKALSQVQNILSIFIDSLNSYFADKSVRFTVNRGLVIESINGKQLEPTMLSSGEKQLLLLLCDTVLSLKEKTIIFLDEPEISLNIKWQRKLLKTLLKITEGMPIQIIVATHSLQVLTEYSDSVVALESKNLE